MNRIVLIGNGFDLAHGLKTSYADFIDWYWEQRIKGFEIEHSNISSDVLCSFNNLKKETWSGFYLYKVKRLLPNISLKEVINDIFDNHQLYNITAATFFANILNCIKTNNWVDIENEYYQLLTEYALGEDDNDENIDELNIQLRFLQNNLVTYLNDIIISDGLLKSDIRQKIYEPFKQIDISIEGQNFLREHVNTGLKYKERELDVKLYQYGNSCYSSAYVNNYRENTSCEYIKDWNNVPAELLLPNQIMLLNFNYTHTANLYCKDGDIFTINQIHGNVEDPEKVIFGYGDELDEDYKEILKLNDSRLLTNIKSIKYLETDNYRKMLSFIESEPYQILIMGHSCGKSDRTLLNTLFEHKNCASIKPYYYVRDDGSDNYMELVQNIHRSFTDMKLMRDRVVNKLYCEPLTR